MDPNLTHPPCYLAQATLPSVELQPRCDHSVVPYLSVLAFERIHILHVILQSLQTVYHMRAFACGVLLIAAIPVHECWFPGIVECRFFALKSKLSLSTSASGLKQSYFNLLE